MKHQVFISYPNSSKDIAENLRDQFKTHNVNAWVYSIDKTLGTNTWDEIKDKINDSNSILFIISNETPRATGQHTELKEALKKFKSLPSIDGKIMPIFLDGVEPANAPEELKHINGEFLNSSNVKSVALKISKTIFPEIFDKDDSTPWKCPIPGQWLKISNLDNQISEYFNLGDKLYFRRISPMGLFECYAPKIEGLFWIIPDNVSISHDKKDDSELTSKIPREFKY